MQTGIDYEQLKIQARNVRKTVLTMVFKAGTSHVGAAFSIVDLLVVLYSHILRISSQDPNNPERDRFILSKGHACTALYAVLAAKGFFPESYLEEYCCNDGKLAGHPDSHSVPGIEFSTGSLGHGLSVGAGMALVAKIYGQSGRSFILLGDGECNEGQVWEAAMFAAQHQLDNLVAIIDYNHLQGFGKAEEVINMEPVLAKWEAFGWQTATVDGHDFFEIVAVFSRVPLTPGKPSVVIARTIKGKGVSFMENRLEWHYKSPNQEQYETALRELDQS
jgi:transketolase